VRAGTYSLGRTRSRSHTRVQDSYGATNDWNDLHSMSNRRSLSVFPRSSSSLCPFTSLFHRRSAQRSSSCSGYLLRGRCGLNLINSMRHLDKCAPRMRIQRIIFILIHLPFSPLSPACLPSLYRSLTSFSGSSSSASSPHEPSAPDARTVSSVIRSPIHTRQARARCEEAREGGRSGEKRTHLSAPISPGSFVFLMSRRI